MRSYDLSPLFRTTVGFDRMARLIDTLSTEQSNGYPPYNIEKLDEDSYQVSMAVAGFSDAELDIEVTENVLKITGRKEVDAEAEEARVYLYRGIAERAFERRFSLADHIKVEGPYSKTAVACEIDPEVPEALKPRTIAISNAAARRAKARR